MRDPRPEVRHTSALDLPAGYKIDSRTGNAGIPGQWLLQWYSHVQTQPGVCVQIDRHANEFDAARGCWEHFGRRWAAAPEMLEALRDVTRALESHLDESCRDHNLKHRDDLCPCNRNEVARARAILAKLEGGQS